MESTFARSVRENEIEPYDYSILIIGGYGTGKTALTNTIVNWVLGNSLSNLAVAAKCGQYKNISPGFFDDNTETNRNSYPTKHANFYKMSSPQTKNKTLLLVDTPGLGSIEGVFEDDANTLEIIRAAKLVKSFNAIFFIQNSTYIRLTQYLEYMIYRISNVIPRDFERSIIMIKTFSAYEDTAIESYYEFPIKKNFLLNNLFFSYNRAVYLQNGKKTAKISKALEKSYRKITKIFDQVSRMDAQSNAQYNTLFLLQNNIFAKYSEFGIHLKNVEKLIDVNSFYSIPKNIKNDAEINIFIKEKERKIIDELREQERLMRNINQRYNMVKQIALYNEFIEIGFGNRESKALEIRESQKLYRNLYNLLTTKE